MSDQKIEEACAETRAVAEEAASQDAAPKKGKISLVYELNDAALVAQNPGKARNAFEFDGVLIFGFRCDEDGGKTVQTECVGDINYGGIGQGIAALPFGRTVIQCAMMADMENKAPTGLGALLATLRRAAQE